MSRTVRVLLAVALVALLVAGVMVEPALAETSKIGDRLGTEVSSWGKALLFGVVALVGLPALFKRDVSQALMIAFIAIILGGFLWQASAVQDIIEAFWGSLAG